MVVVVCLLLLLLMWCQWWLLMSLFKQIHTYTSNMFEQAAQTICCWWTCGFAWWLWFPSKNHHWNEMSLLFGCCWCWCWCCCVVFSSFNFKSSRANRNWAQRKKQRESRDEVHRATLENRQHNQLQKRRTGWLFALRVQLQTWRVNSKLSNWTVKRKVHCDICMVFVTLHCNVCMVFKLHYTVTFVWCLLCYTVTFVWCLLRYTVTFVWCLLRYTVTFVWCCFFRRITFRSHGVLYQMRGAKCLKKRDT